MQETETAPREKGIRRISTGRRIQTSLEDLIVTRQMTLNTLYGFFEREMHWAGIAKLTKYDIGTSNSSMLLQKRTQHFYVLGTSMAAVVQHRTGIEAVHDMAQLMEEFEHFTASTSIQSMKLMRAKPVDEMRSRSSDPTRSQLYKTGKQVFYASLLVSNTPFTLDYYTIVQTVLDVLKLVYSTFLDKRCSTASTKDVILKLDDKIGELVLRPLVIDLDSLASQVLDTGIQSIVAQFGLSTSRKRPSKQSRSETSPHQKVAHDAVS